MNKLLTLIFLVAVSTAVTAQEYVDLLTIKHLHQLQDAEGALPIQTRYSESSVDLLAPIPISDNVTILSGLFGEQTTLSTSERICPTIYSTLLKVGVNIKHTDRFSATYIVLPKIASDLGSVSSDDFQIGGIFLGKYAYSKDFNVRFGVYTNREFYGMFVVPIAGLYWKTGKWEVKGAIPINAEIKYSIVENKFAVGARFDGINRSYNLTGALNGYVEKANNEVGLFAQYQLDKVLFRATVGHSAGRKLSCFDDGDKATLALPAYKIGNDRIEKTSLSPNGVYARFGIIYRLPTS